MKINKIFITSINWILAGLLSILGFSRCDIIEPKTEYGVPNADYTVKGKVVNKTTQKPIKGIRIGYSSLYMAEYGVPYSTYRYIAADTTDVSGNFEFTENTFPDDNPTLIFVNDIDGQENGLYRDTTLIIDFEDAEHIKGKGNWDDGEYIKTLNIELNEEKTDE